MRKWYTWDGSALLHVLRYHPVFGSFNMQYDVICYDMTIYVNLKKIAR